MILVAREQAAKSGLDEFAPQFLHNGSMPLGKAFQPQVLEHHVGRRYTKVIRERPEHAPGGGSLTVLK